MTSPAPTLTPASVARRTTVGTDQFTLHQHDATTYTLALHWHDPQALAELAWSIVTAHPHVTLRVDRTTWTIDITTH